MSSPVPPDLPDAARQLLGYPTQPQQPPPDPAEVQDFVDQLKRQGASQAHIDELVHQHFGIDRQRGFFEPAAGMGATRQAVGTLAGLAPKGGALERLQAAMTSSASRVPAMMAMFGGPENWASTVGEGLGQRAGNAIRGQPQTPDALTTQPAGFQDVLKSLQAGKDSLSSAERIGSGVTGAAASSAMLADALGPLAAASKALPAGGALSSLLGPTASAGYASLLDSGLGTEATTPMEAAKRAAWTMALAKGFELGGKGIERGGELASTTAKSLRAPTAAAVKDAAAQTGKGVEFFGPDATDQLATRVSSEPFAGAAGMREVNPALDAVTKGVLFGKQMPNLSPASRAEVIDAVRAMPAAVRKAWTQGFLAQTGEAARGAAKSGTNTDLLLTALHQPWLAGAKVAKDVLGKTAPAAGVMGEINPSSGVFPDVLQALGAGALPGQGSP